MLLNSTWKKVWAASLVLAALCGFAGGWTQRSKNPPFVITRKTEEPPEIKLLRKGRYDDAAKAVLASIHNEKNDDVKYQSLAAIYAARALKDSANREKWVAQAAAYVEKSVNLAPDDPIDLLQAALGMDRIGDISSQSCQYFEKSREYAQAGLHQLRTDCILIADERFPAQPIRNEFSKVLTGVQAKLEAKCARAH